jgi:hypothetical protein
VRNARVQIEVVAALLAIAASLGTICPCAPPAATASDEHTCCPADEALAMVALGSDCCASHSSGTATLATVDGAPALDAWGVGAASVACCVRAVDVIRDAPLPFLTHPPLVLRI